MRHHQPDRLGAERVGEGLGVRRIDALDRVVEVMAARVETELDQAIRVMHQVKPPKSKPKLNTFAAKIKEAERLDIFRIRDAP